MGASWMVLFVLLLVSVQMISSSCPSASYRDSYTTLPKAPVFPTTYLADYLTPNVSGSNPLTQGHFSETANLAAYRPPKFTPNANDVQTNCPHLRSNLMNWHDPATWGTAGVPTASGANITIPEKISVLISSCSIDPNTVFGIITIPATSSLIIGDASIVINAVGFNVMGSLLAGSATCRLRNRVNITLYGSRDAQPLPADPWIKGIGVTGTIDLHGVRYFPTWTRLAMTAKINDTYLFVQDVVNWQPGQRIVVTTTELKDSRDFNRNEEFTIVSVKLTKLGAVSAIQVDRPVAYRHFGGTEYQAEVALLSRNIVVQGDAINSEPTDTANNGVCKDPSDGSTYPCENAYLTGFGAHIFINGNTSQGRFSGVELYRVGQTNVLGRYAIHFHLLGNITSSNYSNAYVQDSSVHHSFFRCYAIHGTSGIRLSENTAYDAIGHCYFLEDGVEENNIWSYNQAAHIHPLGPYQNPSLGLNGDSWWSQGLSYYTQTSSLLLPSDMAAGCFYITNTYNDIYGNAASGGWAGFSIPSLPLPVKLFASITNMSPANRPFRSPFRGNSAHSSGYWWATAGGIYVGGELSQPNGVLRYTAGRSTSRDTCSDQTAGTPAGSGGCWTVSNQLWLRFEDNKVFLSNRGMQNWGNRAEIIRFELHDVSLSMNVFGQVWVDSMLMECRSQNHVPTWFNGCPAAPVRFQNGWSCNVRDSTFFSSFGGFQWYDVGQQHIVTNTTFRNCRNDWAYCVNGPSKGICGSTAIFTSLTHSDQFVPELMQVTSGLKYQSVTDLWRYSTQLTDPEGVTVSGRCQNWYDADGSASLTGVRTMIGSARANGWWRYNSNCVLYLGAYKCPLSPGDSAASMVMHRDSSLETTNGNSNCVNGNWNGNQPCPIIGQVSHFGMTNESDGFAIGNNAKVTGPLIYKAGGWFIRFSSGTPSTLTLTSIQVNTTDVLLLAIPYPSGTTFNIFYQAASWCSTSWAICQHKYTQVYSVADVVSAFGDAYYWNSATRTLYMRVVQSSDTFGSPGTDKPWTPSTVPVSFARGGQRLITPSYSSSVIIQASCSTNPCAPQNDVPVPAALH